MFFDDIDLNYSACGNISAIEKKYKDHISSNLVKESGDVIETYIVYDGQGNNIRIIRTADNTYKAVDNNDKTIDEITSELISKYFNTGVKNDYPKYLVQLKSDGSYQFLDKLNGNDSDNETASIVGSIERKSFAFNPSSEYSKIALNANKVLGLEKEMLKTCQDILGEIDGEIMTFLKEKVFIVIWIGVPILLIFFTTVDFSKIVFSEDKDGIGNATKRFLKRLVASVLIFLTPTILIVVSNLLGAGDSIQSCMKHINQITE